MRDLITLVENHGQTIHSHSLCGAHCCGYGDPVTINEAAPDDAALDAIRADYRDFNARYFSGELPNIPIAWNAIKGAGAQVVFKTAGLPLTPMDKRRIRLGLMKMSDKHTLLPETVVLQISNRFVRTSEQTKALLLHEMIHVWQIFIRHEYAEDHGREFMDRLHMLEKQSGMTIPVTEQMATAVLADITAKPLGIVIRKWDDYWIAAIVSEKTLMASIDTLPEVFKRDEAKAYVIASEAWTEMSVKRRVQRKIDHKLSFFRIPDALEGDLFANGKLVWSKDA